MQMQSVRYRPDLRKQQSASEASLTETISSIIKMLKRQLLVIIASTLALTLLGVLYVAVAPRTYTAKAQLLSDVKRLQLSQAFGEAPIDPVVAETDIEILKSEKVLLPVIKELDLIENPEFHQPGLLSRLFGITRTVPEEIRTQRVLEALQSALTVSRVGRTQLFDIAVKAHDPELAAQLVNAIAQSFIRDQLDAKADTARRASVWLQERIKQLGEQATNAERAVVQFKIANDIVDAGGGRLMGDQQISELNIKLVAAQNDVSQATAKLRRIEDILAHAQKNTSADATVPDTLSSPVVTKLRDKYLELGARVADYTNRFGPNHLSVVRLRSQMQDIRNSITDELQRLAETYKSDLDISKRKEKELQRSLEEVVARSQATSQAQVKLRDLESTANSYRILYNNFLERHAEQVQQQSMGLSEARLIAPATPPHNPSQPKVLLSLALASIGGLVLGLGIAGVREFMDQVYRTSDQIEKTLSKNCIGLAPQVSTDGSAHLKPQPDTIGRLKEQVSSFLNHLQSATQRSLAPQTSPSPAASVTTGLSSIEEARASSADIQEVRASSGEEAKASSSEVESEAPSNKNDEVASSVVALQRASSTDSEPSERLISDKRGPATAVVDAPLSRFAEAMQGVKLAAERAEPASARVIGITSSLPREGKSTIAANLARLIARSGAKTVLVDCDLRICGLTKILAPKAKVGLNEVVNQALPLSDVVWKDKLTDLEFVPAIAGNARAHPSELFALASTQALFDRLRGAYEWIIVDLPPVGLVVDTQSTAHLLDSYVLVVEWGQTRCSIVKRALDSAKTVNDHLLGVVLNKVDMQQMPVYDSEYMTYAGDYYVEA